MTDTEGRINSVEALGGDYFLLKLQLGQLFPDVNPGQFVMILVDSEEIFLRRPFSIYSYEDDILSILFRVRGRATRALSRMRQGEKVKVLGPLGNGFKIEMRDHYVVIAGGIGAAGLNLLLERLDRNTTFYFGISAKYDEPLLKLFSRFDPKVSSLDGSYGFKGDVISLFSSDLSLYVGSNFEIFACGPKDMYRSLKGCLSDIRVPCQILMEERMGCGLGLCYGCVVETLDENEPLKRVCFEGPRFSLWEISL